MDVEVVVALISAFAVVVAALIGLFGQVRKAVRNTEPVANGFASHVRTSLDQLCKDVGHLVARDEELARRIEVLETTEKRKTWHL